MLAIGRFLNKHLDKYWKRFLFLATAPWVVIEILMALLGQWDFLIVIYTNANQAVPGAGLKFFAVLFGFTTLASIILATQWPSEHSDGS